MSLTSAVLARHVVLSGDTTFSSVCGSYGSRIVRECGFEWATTNYVFKLKSTCGAPFANGENARNAQSDECLTAGVYEFSSPTVKPGHWFHDLKLHVGG